ncbi:hypothetical protein [Pelagibacterium lentulum]|uniref:Surface antigen n=1 Tax=Pelagibacterium lentulum TaxID=2029865 RepID=A0A916RH62_9HYPH|nr:hypothetical protein [Pelagibacterium lentulum]GGA54166.1 hypothetical protein GCM10011499_25400 [Pelagibacterium lentulum]
MNITRLVIVAGLALVLAGCARTGTMPTPQGPTVSSMPATLTQPEFPQPRVTAEPQIQQARLTQGDFRYIDSTALPLLSAGARSAATDAQFYALQFGRPGAPRSWSSGGSSGQVSVGPYVRVNNLDCREFSHRVTVSGQTYTRAGTACRETDGAWNVVDA